MLNTTKGFFQSNSTLSQVVIVLLLVFLLFFAYTFVKNMLNRYGEEKAQNPYILYGMRDANRTIIIPQDPRTKNAITLQRSQNQPGGSVFTYQWWMKIDNVQYNHDRERYIFIKGDPNLQVHGPSVHLVPNTLDMVVRMDVHSGNPVEIRASLSPRRWIHVLLEVTQTQVRLILNGALAQVANTKSVPKQNYYDLHLFYDGGFGGLVSDMRFHSRLMTSSEVYEIIRQGPNLIRADTESSSRSSRDTDLLDRWWLSYQMQNLTS